MWNIDCRQCEILCLHKVWNICFANVKVEKMQSIFSKSGKAAYIIQKRSFCTITFSKGKHFTFCQKQNISHHEVIFHIGVSQYFTKLQFIVPINCNFSAPFPFAVMFCVLKRYSCQNQVSGSLKALTNTIQTCNHNAGKLTVRKVDFLSP